SSTRCHPDLDCLDPLEWIRGSVAKVLFGKKHALPILLYVYQMGAVSTTQLVRGLGGHPKSIIDTLRALERHGVLVRYAAVRGHRNLKAARLSLWGTHLVETSLHHWGRIIGDWDSIFDYEPRLLLKGAVKYAPKAATSLKEGPRLLSTREGGGRTLGRAEDHHRVAVDEFHNTQPSHIPGGKGTRGGV